MKACFGGNRNKRDGIDFFISGKTKKPRFIKLSVV